MNNIWIYLYDISSYYIVFVKSIIDLKIIILLTVLIINKTIKYKYLNIISILLFVQSHCKIIFISTHMYSAILFFVYTTKKYFINKETTSAYYSYKKMSIKKYSPIY